MEDIMKALLDVVRAQHSATEGSEEKPFDINDIIDMAMNITGRPEEPAEQRDRPLPGVNSENLSG